MVGSPEWDFVFEFEAVPYEQDIVAASFSNLTLCLAVCNVFCFLLTDCCY